MHALDFEQLTIETQSMTEKSEGRALAVLSLKAKRTTAVQVINEHPDGCLPATYCTFCPGCCLHDSS